MAYGMHYYIVKRVTNNKGVNNMEQIIGWYKDGMITEYEAYKRLSKLHINGAFREKISDKWFFIGFNYADQKWITIA